MVRIGQRLKSARERAGLSQEYAASELGVSRVTLANWEAGRYVPPLLHFRNLLTLYAASPYAVLYGAHKHKLSVEERHELEEFASKCSVGLRLKISLALTALAVED